MNMKPNEMWNIAQQAAFWKKMFETALAASIVTKGCPRCEPVMKEELVKLIEKANTVEV